MSSIHNRNVLGKSWVSRKSNSHEANTNQVRIVCDTKMHMDEIAFFEKAKKRDAHVFHERREYKSQQLPSFLNTIYRMPFVLRNSSHQN